MKSQVLFVALSVCLMIAGTSRGEKPRFTQDGGDVFHGGLVGDGRATRDTTYLLGGPGRLDGKFQDAAGFPDWHGWTHLDATYDPHLRWQVSDYRSPTGTPAIWCGQDGFANACGAGYGNNWREDLVFRHAVPDPQAAAVVRLQCVFNSDSEPGFDYFRIQCNRGGTWQDIVPPYDYVRIGIVIDETITFQPGDYAGPGGDEVQLRFRGDSDGAWSDEDCLYDSEGLAQVDDIRVTIDGQTFLDDFDDGIVHHWTEVEQSGCGDFAKIWQNLQDIDPCVSNSTPQVAFIDDGVVVPGTGGSPCITWCYGPGGYIVNPTGGLLGPEYGIENLIISPPLEWPAGYDGAVPDLRRLPSRGTHHQRLAGHLLSVARAFVGTAPGGLASATWEDRNFVYYGKGYRSDDPVGVGPARTRSHPRAGRACAVSSTLAWNDWNGVDGTPAPYFDNVAFKAFPFEGPALTARAIDLAQDSFPERGELDLANLANNWVRFDMASTISPDAHLRNDPGDSILVDIALPRAGSVLNEHAEAGRQDEGQSAVRRGAGLAGELHADRRDRRRLGVRRFDVPAQRHARPQPLPIRPARLELPLPGRPAALLRRGAGQPGRRRRDRDAAGRPQRHREFLAAHDGIPASSPCAPCRQSRTPAALTRRSSSGTTRAARSTRAGGTP